MSLFGRHRWGRTAGTGHEDTQADAEAPEAGEAVPADPEGVSGAQEGGEA